MKFVLILCALSSCAFLSLPAATVLQVQHIGSNDPRTEGFSGPSPTATNVITQAVTVGGTAAWSITDPGIAPDGKSNNNNYTKTFTDAQLVSLLQNGWSMSATVSIPNDTPTIGVAWNADSQAWVGAYYKHAPTIEGIATATQRIAWGLMLGRDAAGKTLASLYLSGKPSITLDPGFHTYEWFYNPLTKLASVYVDGQYWTDYAGTISTTGTINQFYWGDNNGQSAATNLPRTAYYSHVLYSIAPEPSKTLLSTLALGWLVLRRKRRMA